MNVSEKLFIVHCSLFNCHFWTSLLGGILTERRRYNHADKILKLDESCISNPKSEILNWTVNCEVQSEISKFRI